MQRVDQYMTSEVKQPLPGQPVYLQIEFELRTEITSGLRSPGELLPSESALMSKYGTSRETVRRGMKELEHKGLVYPHPGKGYFVSAPEHSLYSFYFTDKDKGFDVKYHRINTETATSEVRSALALPDSQRVIKISRIILLHNAPVAYDEKYLPYDKGVPVIENEIEFAVFQDIVKSPPFAFYTNMEIGAEKAGTRLGKILKCDVSDSLLVLYRYIIGQDDKKLGYGKKYITQKYGRLEAFSGYRE